MSLIVPEKSRPTSSPGLKPMLGLSLALHLAILSLIPVLDPGPVPPRKKPQPVLAFRLPPVKPVLPPKPAPKPPVPTPPPPKKAEPPPGAKKADPPPKAPEAPKPSEAPKAPDLSRAIPRTVKLGGAKDHPTNDQDKGSLPSAVKDPARDEPGKGARPEEKAPEKAAARKDAGKMAQASEKPGEKPTEARPDAPREPPKASPPPPPVKPSPPPPKPPRPEVARRPEPPKARPRKEPPAPRPPLREKILRDPRGRPIDQPLPRPPVPKPRPARERSSEDLLAAMKRPEPIAPPKPPMEVAPMRSDVSADRHADRTRGQDADPLSGVTGFIPLSQALQKLSRGGPVPRFMPDSITANVSADGAIGMDEFREILLAHLQRYKVWPEHLRGSGITGQVFITCRVDGFTGHLIDYRIWRSSGLPEIDRAGVATVEKCSPFPAIGHPGTLYLDLVLRYDENEDQRAGI